MGDFEAPRAHQRCCTLWTGMLSAMHSGILVQCSLIRVFLLQIFSERRVSYGLVTSRGESIDAGVCWAA